MKTSEINKSVKSVILTNNDIITKGHTGEIKVETREGEGAEIIITLPIA